MRPDQMIHDHEWHDYNPEKGYDKAMWAIELHNGEILQPVYPNAGRFTTFGKDPRTIKLTDVKKYRLLRVEEFR